MCDVMGYEKSRSDGLRYDRQIKEILNLFRLRQNNNTLGAKLETPSDCCNRFCLFVRAAFVAPERFGRLPPPIGRHLFQKKRWTWNGWRLRHALLHYISTGIAPLTAYLCKRLSFTW